MKQTTLIEYLKNEENTNDYQREISNKLQSPLRKNQILHEQKNTMIKSYIQKSLSQLIKEQEDLNNKLEDLGDSWFKQDGFGYTDKENIMCFSTTQDFNNTFFKLYQFEDFKLIEDLDITIENLEENREKYKKIENLEYNTYYLSIALKILENNYESYLHEKLKLLLLRNSKYSVILCPKF